MNINTALEEWANLGASRKFEILTNLFRDICFNGDPESDEIYNLLTHYAELEADDYFGTEGLEV
jgi:hypothetical protein